MTSVTDGVAVATVPVTLGAKLTVGNTATVTVIPDVGVMVG